MVVFRKIGARESPRSDRQVKRREERIRRKHIVIADAFTPTELGNVIGDPYAHNLVVVNLVPEDACGQVRSFGRRCQVRDCAGWLSL